MYRRAVRAGSRVARRVGGYVAGAAMASGYKYAKKATKRYVRKRTTKTSAVRSSIGRKMLQPVVKKTVYLKNDSGAGNELSTVRRTTGRYPRLTNNRLFKLMKAGMTDTVLRAQGITNFDTTVGYYPLANRAETEGLNILPMHVWDLTTFPNQQSAVTAGYAYGWANLLATSDLTRLPLSVQNTAGARDITGKWQVEKTSGATKNLGSPEYCNASKIMHDWVDIKINLYGARKRGTTFYIDVVRCKEEFANLVAASVANQELKELVRTMTSNLIYSNLQSYNSRNLKKLQILKSYKFYVPGGSQDDLDTIGKIKEFKLFLRQGNVYNYAWQAASQQGPPHTQEDGIDFPNYEGVNDNPHPGSRVFLVIRAFSPERKTQAATAWNTVDPAKGIYEVPADPLTEPSYDIVIRNKFTLPN